MATYRLKQLVYASEVAFASTAENPSTLTWDQMVPAENIVLRIDQPRIPDQSSRGRENEFGLSHIGTREAELEFTTTWHGNITDPGSSTLTERWPETLLGYAIGGKRTAGAGSTISGTSSSVSAIYVASTVGFSATDFCAIGVKGDGRGDGQIFAIGSTVSATSGLFLLHTETPAAPTTAGDTVSRVAALYRDETAALTTTRWLCLYSDTGAQFMLLGAQLAGFSITWDMAGRELPKATWRYRAAYWQRSAVTFPYTSVTVQDNTTTPPAGGSVFLNTFGTGTRVTKGTGQLTVDFETDILPTIGPGGNGTYQTVTGWTRQMWAPRVTALVPWETAQETIFDLANPSYTYHHMLFTSNPTGGRRTGFYARRMFYEGNRPSNVTEFNGLNYVQLQWKCTESTDTTSALSRTPLVLLCG